MQPAAFESESKTIAHLLKKQAILVDGISGGVNSRNSILN
jgi:hypothetical protein